jgi:predicted patatin/cPLA2 family phospholipase
MKPRRRVGLVLSGGGARGAYEVGVLAHLFEQVLPKLPPDFGFAITPTRTFTFITSSTSSSTAISR